MVLIGEATAEDGEVLQKIYSRVCMNSPHIARMSVVSAEIAKISLNSFVTMKISFANTLAMLCESIPGANIDHITKALGADRRVSPYYFTGGLSYGGPCFPRDNRAFAAFARSLGRDASLALATDVVNQTRVDDVVGRILLSVPKNTTSVSVLGLAYKPDTPVVEESPGIMIAEALVQAGFTVLVYDQLAVEDARQVLRERVTYAASMQECFERSSVIIITTQDSAFKEISGKDVRLEGTMIIDCWRQLDPGSLGDRAMYVPLGIFRETRAETRDG
jgi:UDPglucose 6-dehydrogenase